MASAEMSILIEGIDEASDTLENIGDAGEESADQIETSFEGASDSLDEVEDSASGLSTTLKTALVAGITAATGAMGVLTNRVSQYADDMLDTAAYTAMSTEALQEWEAVAQNAGVSADAIATAQYRLNRQLTRSSRGSAKLRDALEDLNIEYETFKDMDAGDRMDLLITRLSEMDDETRRAEVGTALFRGGWRDMAPIVNEGAKTIEEAKEQAHESGAIMGEDALVGADQWRRALVKLRWEITGLVRQVVTALTPALNNRLVPILENKITPAIRGTRNVLVVLTELVGRLDTNIIRAVTSFAGFLAILKGGPVVFSALAKVLGFIVGLLSAKVIAIGAVLTALSTFISSNETTAEVLRSVWMYIQQLIVDVLNAIIDFLGEHGKSVLSIIDSLMVGVLNITHRGLKEMARVISFSLAFIRVLWRRYGDDTVNYLSEIWSDIVPNFTPLLGDIESDIEGFYDDVLELWEDEEKSLTDKLVGTVRLGVGLIYSIASSVWEWFGEQYPTVFGWYDAIKNWVNDLSFEKIILGLDMGVEWSIDIIGSFRDKIEDTRKGMRDLTDYLMDFDMDLSEDYEEGEDMGEGIVESIEEGVNSQEAKNLAGSVWRFARDLFYLTSEILGLLFIDIPSLIMAAIDRGFHEAEFYSIGARMAGAVSKGFKETILPEWLQKPEDEEDLKEKVEKAPDWIKPDSTFSRSMDKVFKTLENTPGPKHIIDAMIGFYGRDKGTGFHQAEELGIGTEESKENNRKIAAMIRAEAGNQPFEGKRAVAEVILNRLTSPDFSNTVDEVLSDKKQFESYGTGRYQEILEQYESGEIKLEEESKAILEAIGKSGFEAEGSLYFGNMDVIKDRHGEDHWMINSDKLKKATDIGEHTFFISEEEEVPGFKKGKVPGVGRGDKEPAMLEPGEAVIPRGVLRGGLSAVSKFLYGASPAGYQDGKVSTEGSGGIFGKFVIELESTLKDTLDLHHEQFEDVESTIDEVFEEALKDWDSVIEGGEEFVETIEGIEELSPKQLREFIGGLSEIDTDTEDAESEIEKLLEKYEDLDYQTEETGQKIGNLFEVMASNIRGQLPLIDRMVNGYQSMVTRLKELDEKENVDLSGMWDNIKSRIIELTPDFMMDMGSGIKDMVGNIASDMSPTIKAALGPIGGFVGTLIGESEQFQKLMEKLQPVTQAIANMFGALIAPLEPIINLLTWLTPIFEALGMILEQAIEPVFRLLFPVVKLVAMGLNRLVWVLQHIRRGFYEVMLDLAEGVDSLPFVDAGSAIDYLKDTISDSGESIDDLNDNYDELKDMTYDNAEAKEEEKEKTEELNDALHNAPEIFNRALARTETLDENTVEGNDTSGSSTSSTEASGSSSNNKGVSREKQSDITIEEMVVNIVSPDDPRELWRKMKRVIKDKAYANSGSTQAT